MPSRLVLNHRLEDRWYEPDDDDHSSHRMEQSYSSSSQDSYRSHSSSESSSHDRYGTTAPYNRENTRGPRNSNARVSHEDAAPSPDSSSRSTTADGPRYCYHPTCLDTSGRPKRPEPYSRKADLKRHVESTHEKRFLDCTFKRCDRRGENGFTRKDHRTEHLRGYHRMGIPKRENGGGGRGEGREEDWGRERGLTEGTGGLKRGREREFR